MTSRVFFAAVLTLAATGLALPGYGAAGAPAASRQAPRTLAPRHDRALDALQAELGKLTLTAAEKTAVDADIADYQAKTQAFVATHRDELRKLNTEFRTAQRAHDKAQLQTLRTERQALQKDAPKIKELMQQIDQTLTPAQRKELHEALKQERRAATKPKHKPTAT